MSRPSLKRKLYSSFTSEEIELPTPKKFCLNPPQLFTSYPTDIWSVILLKLCTNCVLSYDEHHGLLLTDLVTCISLSETCKYFKYIIEQPMVKNIINLALKELIPYIQGGLTDCNKFFGRWDETKDFGIIKEIEFKDFISQYSYHKQIVICHQIDNFCNSTLYTFTQFMYAKEYIDYHKKKKKWENFLKLFPKKMIEGMKTNIYYKNLFY